MYAVLPQRLELARRAGKPDFMLHLFRGADPLKPPTPYGVLDLRLEAVYPLEAALGLARADTPQATVQPVTFSGGWLRLVSLSTDLALPAAATEPQPLAWNGLSNARYSLRLPLEQAMLLRGALENELLPLEALAELEYAGAAARLPVQVRFDPARLLAALHTLAPDGSGIIAYDQALGFFRQEPADLPVALSAAPADKEIFAAAMLDRLRLHLAEWLPAPQPGERSYLRLAPIPAQSGGVFNWDLSATVETRRPLALMLKPFEIIRQVIAEFGLAAIAPEPAIIPPMPTGVLPVSISANLPDQPLGVMALGVTLHAPPKLPFRPGAIIESIELTPPDYQAQAMLRFSPTETPAYTSSTFTILRKASGGFMQVDGEPVSRSGSRLSLSPADFPLRFIPVSASPALLALGNLEGSLTWEAGGSLQSQTFTLSASQASQTLTLPLAAGSPQLTITARPLGAGAPLALTGLPAAGLALGLHSFPEYGPHTIAVSAIFPPGAALLAVELRRAADPPETAGMLLALTPGSPHKSWTYLAESPFQSGYHYRLAPAAGQPAPAEWSPERSPFEALVLQAPQPQPAAPAGDDRS